MIKIKEIITKRFFWIISIITLVIALIIITLSLKIDSFSLTTIKKSYCYVCTYNETQEIEVLVYLSSKRSYATEKDKVTRAYIQSENRQDKLLIDLVSINDKDKKEKINKRNFYLYSFVFEIPLVTTEEYDLCINDARILLEYANENIEIKIGSFYFYKIPYFGDNYNNLSVAKIKPIVNYLYTNKTLTGLDISFHNNTNQDITITRIKLFNENVYPSVDDIQAINKDIKTTDTLNSILGYNYNSISNDSIYSLNTNLQIYSNDYSEYIVPLKYLNDYIIDKLGFMIDYEMNGQKYSLYYDDFVLFTDVSMIVNTNDLDIQVYENK